MADVTSTVVADVGRSLWADAWARLKANKAAVVSGYFLV
ncbi:MAG TPA: ABC transporter permease, partial [Aestuariivirga sp.]